MQTLQVNDLDSSRKQLLEQARELRETAYTPYSNYNVGTALRASDGEIFTGHNIEYVIYTTTLHAEQLALAEAVKNGYREPGDFDVLLVSSKKQGRTEPAGDPPCGICLQSLIEFCSPELDILVDSGDTVKHYALKELLPEGMQSSSLDI